MRDVVHSIEGEYRRYRKLAEDAMAQLDEPALCRDAPGGGNSIAALVWHLSGNLASRFTDFLSSDGEKPWRKRDEEFEARLVSREELLAKWGRGWEVLVATLATLSDADLSRSVAIRGTPLRVDEALHRSLAHTAYHVGQIVLLAKSAQGARWKYLSIPPGMSEQYNRAPTKEKG